MSIITEYFDYLEEYQKKYGESTVLLMQIGSFFESYAVNNKKEKLGNAQEIAQLLNIQLTKKNKKILEVNRKNPQLVGVPCCALDKYLPVLLQNNYTVVLVEQVTPPPKPERKVTNIFSPGTIINKEVFSSYTTVLYLEKNKDLFIAGIAAIDPSNSNCVVHEIFTNKNDLLENIQTFFKCYPPNELIIYNNTESCVNNEKFSFGDILTHFYSGFPKEYSNPEFQNEFLKKVYNSETLLSTIEFLDLETKPTGTLSLLLLIDFIYKHNENILKNISKPEFYDQEKHLILMGNTLDQLDFFSSGKKTKSVFDILNKCITSIGKRQLKHDLLFPIRDPNELNSRYNLIEKCGKLPLYLIEKKLYEILDISKLHRLQSIGLLNPCDFLNLDTAYKAVLEISEKTKQIGLEFNEKNDLQIFIDKYTLILNLEKMSSYSLDNIENSFFIPGNFKDIDDIQQELDTHSKALNEIAERYSLLISEDKSLIKVSFLDKEHFFLTTTNVRANLLKKKVSSDIIFVANKSGVRITSKQINELSEKIVILKETIQKAVKSSFVNLMLEYFIKNQEIFKKVIEFIGRVDVTISNFKVSEEFCYTKPNIVNSKLSFVNAKGLRHLLIERINQNVKFISNDITLNGDGIVLYGINASGKSSLIKALGISIILAQAGMYVPADIFNFSPFHHLITRLQGSDNLHKAQSSFVVEMMKLRNILKNANKNSMIIMDELSSSTEVTSANAIVISSLLELTKANSNFILATHFSGIAEFPEIKTNSKIHIKHLTVDYTNGHIVYNRKLMDGPINSVYGLEVAKFLGLPNDFMEQAYRIRNLILNKKTEVISTKKSRYNAKKIIDKCEICGNSPIKNTDLPLDVHHINFQCNANSKGMINNFHKNELHNLVVLCKKCHIDTHSGKIKINGYIQTSIGLKLDFEFV